MKSAIYARKSSDNDAGVERQVEIATDFITAKGWTLDLAHVYTDNDVSGADFDRPGLNGLLAAVEAGEVDTVVMMNVDRLSRGTIAETLALQQRILKTGCELWYYQTGARVSLDTATDELKGAIDAYGARDFRDQIKVKTAAALRKMAQQGHVTGGKLYGYRNVRPSEKQPVHREIDADQAAVVKRIFERYVAGEGHQAIREALNTEKVAGPRGPWANTTIRDVLQNQHYIGRVTWGKTKPVVRKGKTINVAQPPSSWITLEVPALRIIEDALWQKAQARREQTRQATPRGRGGRLLGRTSQADQRSEHIFSGFLRCGLCGGPILIETEIRGAKGKRHPVRTYLCATNHQRGTAGCENATRVRKGNTEAAIMAAIRSALSPEVVEEALETFLAARRATMGQRDERRTAIEREMGEVAKREARLVTAITSGGEIGPLVAALKQENAKREALEVEMSDLTAMPSAPKLWGLAEDAYRAAVRTRVADVFTLLDGKSGIGPTRLMLRRSLEGPVTCWPVQENGSAGFRFEARLAVGLILGDTLKSPAVSSPPGTSTCRAPDGWPGG